MTSAGDVVGGDSATDQPDLRTRAASVGPTPSWWSASGMSAWDAIGLVLGGLLLVAFAPPLIFESWTPRFVLGLIAAPMGLLVVVWLALRRDIAAVAALMALAWVCSAALAGPAPRSALLGYVGRELSVVVIALAIGCWGVGRAMSDRGRSALVGVVVWAAIGTALVALLQVLGDVRTGPLALASGRPTGLHTNPVYLGAVCAAVLLVAVGWARRPVALVPIALLGVAVSLSGSRVAAAAVVVSLAVLVAVHRTLRTAAYAGAGVAALGVGVLVDRIAGSGRNAADRLADGSGGRGVVWRYGLEAIGDRPILGWGTGRFRAAVQGRFTPEFVRDHAPDEITQPWFDAHNALIMVAVGAGVVGALLLVGWIVAALRHAHGPLAWGLLPIALHWMLQPISLHLLLVAALMLGASGRMRTPIALGRRPIVAAAFVGALLGGSVLVLDAVLARAVDRGDAEAAARVARVVSDDPILADLVAQLEAQSGDATGALEWRRRAAEAEPDRPFWWTRLAQAQLETGDLTGARASVERARELQTHNPRTIVVAAAIAAREGDVDELAALFDELCVYEPAACDLDPAEAIDNVRSSDEAAAG